MDYRPALRQRSGVGEFLRHLIAALAAGPRPERSGRALLELVPRRARPECLRRPAGGQPACAGAGAQSTLACTRMAAGRDAGGRAVRHRAFPSSTHSSEPHGGVGGDHSRFGFPVESGADRGRDSTRLPAAGARPCAPRRPHHRQLAVHGRRGSATARCGAEPDHGVPGRRAGLAGAEVDSRGRTHPLLRHPRAAKEHPGPARRLRAAAGHRRAGPRAGARRTGDTCGCSVARANRRAAAGRARAVSGLRQRR